MKFSKNLFPAVVAVLFVFINQTQGGVTQSLSQSALVEKIVTDQQFQAEQHALIMIGKDKDSLDAKKAIEDVQEIVRKFPVSVVSPLAVNTSIEGILEAIRLINAIIHQGNQAIDAASQLVKAQNTEGAIDLIKKGLKADRELVFITGVPIHDAQGSALALVGGLGMAGLRNAIISIQRAGGSVFEILEIADGLATAGIKAGGRAAEEAFKSARNVLTTGSEAIYSHFNGAATHALEGIQYAVSKTINEIDLVPGIIDSLKTSISTTNAGALDAVAKVSRASTSALRVLTKKPLIDAVNIISAGIKSTIIETADAISVAKNALNEAGKLAPKDPEASVALMRRGIKEAQDKLLSGSAFGYLAVGAAGQIGGKFVTEGLVPSVLDIEYGRVAAYEDLALAERVAIVGIRGGGPASEQGISTALQMCDAAAETLYQDYVEAGDISFEFLRKL